ncbi:aminotransferase class I/II-fold pyridoxal phosphate-dependent enzyme [Chitinophaga solisilvae]|uniref:Pyridoxal phosphate-dependent aminotransferase family protein n=1 Tax=Chitinophaga solisilvae TaxID=1233460 RepID=A0A433WA16_9BACT|nr:aminotransferase class I/II-fold pyridoxal phosphate-dependent enzyme [Chitinophaga solisilvae]NSL87801.1 pyridoxal phosphate-dependent aminotransferase family protein [Chitinophaga solisilvae]
MLHTDLTPGRTVIIEGRSCLFFSGFSYLGLHQHPDFKAVLTAGIEQYGTLFPSSRAGNVRLSLFAEAEHSLSTLLQQQAAVVFSSGYMAAQAAVHYAATRGELCYAPGAHPSLWHHTPQLPDISYHEWTDATISKVNSAPDNTYVIVADAVNPLTSTINSFDWLRQLERRTLVLIDDSHGIGILGPQGQGIIHFLPGTDHLHYLITASMAKAFSLEAGVVAGNAADIAALKRSSFFTGSTPMMPANAYAWLHAQPLIQQLRRQLQQNIAFFLHLTADTPVHNPHALPIFVLPQNESQPPLAAYLAERDVIISSFPYPFPHSSPVNRAIISALHVQKDMITLQHFLSEVGFR